MTAHDHPVLEFRNPIFNAGHNITVRRGSRWDGVAMACLRLADGSASSPVVLRTEIKNFSTLVATDLQFEHDPSCRTPEGLLAELQRIYPGFRADEDVTLCHFHLEPQNPPTLPHPQDGETLEDLGQR